MALTSIKLDASHLNPWAVFNLHLLEVFHEIGICKNVECAFAFGTECQRELLLSLLLCFRAGRQNNTVLHS